MADPPPIAILTGSVQLISIPVVFVELVVVLPIEVVMVEVVVVVGFVGVMGKFGRLSI